LVDNHTALLFEPGNPAAAAAAIVRLAREPELRAQIRDRASVCVRDRYTRPVAAAAWDRAMRRILDLPPRPAVALPPLPPAPGRLTRWLPAAAADWLRARLGRPGPDRGPGGEWPHAYGHGLLDQAAFLARARELDRPGSLPA
jgi:hypothetical protein